MRALAPPLALVLALTCARCTPVDGPYGQAEQAVTQCPGASVLNGVDVSNGNGAINWSMVHGAGYDFALMKATQGTGYTDPRFAANWSNSRAAGVVRGAYHFFDPTVDGVAQANHFLAVMGTLAAGDLPPMLDIECPDGDPMCLGYAGGSGVAPAATIRQRMLDWLNTVQTATGRTPMIYTFVSYFTSNGVDTTGLERYPLFIANINATSCFTIPAPWTMAAIRQYSWTGTVPGIGGQVDLDHFFGTTTDLMNLGMGASQYGARFVAQSWPFAAAGAITMHPGQVMAASIDLRNIGTRSWDTNTRFATTQPRDRTSPFAGSDWVQPDRPAAVTGTVAPGATFHFAFDLHAPAMLGHYDEHFGMVEEGVTWFSDPSQGGPPDNQIEMLVDVTPDPDAGLADGGTHDAGSNDAGSNDAARDGAGGDASLDGGRGMQNAGCGCAIPGMPRSSTLGAIAAAILAACASRRKRRAV